MNTRNLLVIVAIIVSIGIIFEIKDLLNNGTLTTSNASGISLSINPNPLQPGPATFMIEVKDKNGKPVDGAKVSYDLNMTTMNMGMQQGDATSQGNGQYKAVGRISMSGPWRLWTKITMPDGNVENKDFTIDVP